ncbi:restriction endonuclease subunit S [Campylobacter vicugnae]|uniref:restriction endonuclease subunit S n=1 Tax=Campylobacter vicugnae TaxID=1660076 RepID=UPI000A35A5A1|nr:restriction endonuclease subunit S [Campylobacter sp. RM8835]
MMNKIPKGWEVKKLGEIFNIVTGKTPSKKIREYFNGNIPFVKPSDLDLSDYIENSEDTLTQDGFKKAPFIPKNSVLVSCIGNLGKKAILKQNGSCNQQINAILPNSNFDMKFVFYYIDIIKPWMKQNASATTISILNKSRFEQMPFIYPNLTEQKAIVDKLDDSFAKIENAITNLTNAKENLKLYKQSVLKSAFNGDLVPSTSPTHWEVKKLGEIFNIVRGGSPRPIKSYLTDDKNGINWIKIGDIETGSKYITHTKQKILASGLKKSRAVKAGDLLLTNSMSFGRPYISKINGAVHDGWLIFEPKIQISKDYVFYFFSSSDTYSKLSNLAVGSTVKNLQINFLENFEIPLPPLSEQNLIVAEIDRRFAIVDKTLNLIDKSIQNAKNLKQSILKKAFSGELRSEI